MQQETRQRLVRVLSVLLVVVLLGSFVGFTYYMVYRLDRAVDGLEVAVDELERSIDEFETSLEEIERDLEELKRDIEEIERRVVGIESAVVENTARLEHIEGVVEEITEVEQEQPGGWNTEEPEPAPESIPEFLPFVPVHQVDVEEGDAVWGLLIEFLGRYPTREEINRVVAANGLEAFDHSTLKDSCGDPLYIVLIYSGNKVDLGPALGDTFSYVYV